MKIKLYFFIITIIALSLLALFFNNYNITGHQILNFEEIDLLPNQVFEFIGNDDVIILDVRTPEEFSSHKVKESINVNYYSSNFKNEISILDKNKTYFVICRSGNRSGNAVEFMKKIGFGRVYNVKGGILYWNELDLPIV